MLYTDSSSNENNFTRSFDERSTIENYYSHTDSSSNENIFMRSFDATPAINNYCSHRFFTKRKYFYEIL
jgi:hypothetical protein